MLDRFHPSFVKLQEEVLARHGWTLDPETAMVIWKNNPDIRFDYYRYIEMTILHGVSLNQFLSDVSDISAQLAAQS